MFYLVDNGCKWRALPHDYPPYSTVHSFYRRARINGLWEKILQATVEKTRVEAGRNPTATYGLIDSQSVKTVYASEDRGFDGGGNERAEETYSDGHDGEYACGGRSRSERNVSKISEEKRREVLTQIQKLDQVIYSLPSGDPMDRGFKRLVYVRYADDFLIGVIGSKEDAKKIKSDVGAFLSNQLHLELSAEKTLITHGNDFARFLAYDITTSNEQNRIRTKAGHTMRFYPGRVKLYVPKEKWFNRLISYGALKISYNRANGNKEIWKPSRRPGLIRLDNIEILNQYNAEVRGLYNYYRLAHNVTVLNDFLYAMKFSMYKTFAGKYRTTMRKIIRRFSRNRDFVVSYLPRHGRQVFAALL